MSERFDFEDGGDALILTASEQADDKLKGVLSKLSKWRSVVVLGAMAIVTLVFPLISTGFVDPFSVDFWFQAIYSLAIATLSYYMFAPFGTRSERLESATYENVIKRWAELSRKVREGGLIEAFYKFCGVRREEERAERKALFIEAAGIPVVMTRTEDILLYDRGVNYQGRKKALDLAARQLIAERVACETSAAGGTSLFISIHMNAFPAPQYSGMQVWYGVGDPASKEVADAIQAASLSLMPSNRRKTKAAGSSIYLLEHIRTPAVLVECGFLSNPEEAERLSTEAYQYALAAAIFAGVVGE